MPSQRNLCVSQRQLEICVGQSVNMKTRDRNGVKQEKLDTILSSRTHVTGNITYWNSFQKQIKKKLNEREGLICLARAAVANKKLDKKTAKEALKTCGAKVRFHDLNR